MMSQIEDLEKRIARLEDESAVRAVIYDYCFKQDQRNVEAFLDILTDDIHFTFPGWQLELNGKDELKPYFLEQVFATHEFNNHKVTNVNIKLDGDKAQAEAYLSLHSSYQGDPQEACIRYMFQARREDGKWRLNDINCEAITWKGSAAPQDESTLERFKV